MISITNIGPQTDDPGGERMYEVRVNQQLICRFVHARRDLLSVCIDKAARAVREQEHLELLSIYKGEGGGEI